MALGTGSLDYSRGILGKQGHEIQEPACSLQPKTPEQEAEVKSGECIWRDMFGTKPNYRPKSNE